LAGDFKDNIIQTCVCELAYRIASQHRNYIACIIMEMHVLTHDEQCVCNCVMYFGINNYGNTALRV
jgi:hypothetical protein